MRMEKKNVESELHNIKIEFVEFYVGTAKAVVYWHVKALGFKVIAYCGPETGNSEKVSYLIVKNDIKLIITSAINPISHHILSYVNLHGDAIKRIGIKVNDITTYFNKSISKGGIPIEGPQLLSDDNGIVEFAILKLFDDNEIFLIDNNEYSGDFMPGFINIEADWEHINEENSEISEIDHIACALRINEMFLWENYLNNILASKTIEEYDERRTLDSDKKIGMYLKALQTQNKKINKVLVEPELNKKNQVQLYITENYGSGIQHLAFKTNNIVKTVEILKKNGVKFNNYPDSYYVSLQQKYPNLDIQDLKKYGILCDVDENSLLLQTFTSPIGDRPTFFYEFIQRVNDYDGFGLNNIQALFEALESEIIK